MKIILLGTGAVVPERDRAQSGILVKTRSRNLLLDCGDGVLRRICESGNSIEAVDHLILTHNHLDHNADFLSITRARQEAGKDHLYIYGPAGTRKLLSKLIEAYDLQHKVEAKIRELRDSEEIEIGGIRVFCREAKHMVPALCCKVCSEGKSLVYSGDTKPCEGIKTLCKEEADLLIHECSFPDGYEKPAGHTTPEELGKLIAGLPVKKLAITHLYPPTIARLQEVRESIERYYRGSIIVGEDLLEVEV